MKSFIAAAFVAAVAAKAGTTEPLRFTSSAQGPYGTYLYAGTINANDRSFWVGKDTATSVPPGTDPRSVIGESNTKNDNTTIFTYLNGQGTLNLDVVVPRGQAVFVNEFDGKLSFTRAGDPDTGAGLTDGFDKVHATLQFEGQEWLGCGDNNGGYEIFAASRASTDKAGCLGFTWKLNQVAAVYLGGPSQAYEYD